MTCRKLPSGVLMCSTADAFEDYDNPEAEPESEGTE